MPGRPFPAPSRRTLLRGGLTATAAGALGLAATDALAVPAPRAARTRAAVTAAAAAAEPRVHTTAEWGARPPSAAITVENRVPAYMVVHHTANPGNSTDYSLEHAKEIARAIQNAHMDGNGWDDSGQQFTNSRGGFVLEGRHRSLEVVRGGTQHVVGAHVGGRNSECIGIENEGLYTDVDVPAALWDSLVSLVAWIVSQYGMPVSSITGHRDFTATECPGDVLYGRLQELRDAVAARLGVASAAPEAWPLLRPGDTGQNVRSAQHLLRAQGFTEVRADGMFGTTTREAVATLVERHGLQRHSCNAMFHRKDAERGYLGADLWPLITPDRAGGDAEVAKALESLPRTRVAASGDALSTTDWKRLLA